MVEFLVQLKELFIANCKNVEEVISVDGFAEAESLSQILCFPKLEILVLDDLPKLRRFCYGNYFEFPFLIGFRIKKCSALKTFISGFAIENETQIAQRGVEDNSTAVDDSLSLFNEKVAFPSLERLTIIGGGSWRNICHDQFHRDSFCKLNLLWVHDCDRLLYVFPFDMRGRLEKLEEMGISCCDSLEEIFEPQGLNVSELQAVTTNQSVRFVFPNLQILRLSMLPKLKSFCSRIHTAEWPSLKKMCVYGCDKVEIFASENLNFGETSINQQSLFWVNEVTFPNLEELELEWNDTMKEIWHGQLPEKFFCKLKVLKLVFFLEESAALPHCFIQSLPNLEKLVVKCAPFNHIFQCEGHGDEERHGLAMTQLIKLKLVKLPELAHIWKEEFQPRAAFFNLRTLEVQECGKLKNLVPSSVSFANLTTLEVSKCHGLINLISSSTAKSLMQLTKMSVIDCLMIEEIIAAMVMAVALFSPNLSFCN
ncbi:uncharacterized protein LOC111277752 [Durio zibethinus]|uniref:Uncharacterized protein LOC111277752 n=1 Tax=Durio zibethinus TaxID=66656 RepID=A0A6P5WWM5_DURZI|nr:uncharacterized protein LOC111277752 [Durio zibethinus]